MKTLCFFVVILLLPWQASAASFKLVHRYGRPIANREAAWNGHVDFASWLDDENVVFASRSGDVTCISLKDDKIQWTAPNVKEFRDWSLSRKTKRLACLAGDDIVSVIDCTNGKSLFNANPQHLARILGLRYAMPYRLAITRDDGRLIVCNFSQSYGRHGYTLDPPYEKVSSTFHVDALPKELSVSPKGGRIAVVADKDVLCVRDIATDGDVFFLGERVTTAPRSLTRTFDVPFFSHLRDGDSDTIVYTEDNSWGIGRVFVHNIKAKNVKSFPARNGHIELDVSFPARRIVLTGTSADLTLLDFDGKLLAHAEKTALQRNMCVEFSPNGQQVLVGSWDNTLSIFRIDQDEKRGDK